MRNTGKKLDFYIQCPAQAIYLEKKYYTKLLTINAVSSMVNLKIVNKLYVGSFPLHLDLQCSTTDSKSSSVVKLFGASKMNPFRCLN